MQQLGNIPGLVTYCKMKNATAQGWHPAEQASQPSGWHSWFIFGGIGSEAAIRTEAFGGFLQSSKTNAGIVLSFQRLTAKLLLALAST
jgi:hypothetical protein